MSPGAPKIRAGQKYKVPPNFDSSLEDINSNMILVVARTPKNNEMEIEMLDPVTGNITKIRHDLFLQLTRIIPIEKNDRFRIRHDIEIPPFLREKGVTHKCTVTVCEKPHPDNPGGLVTVKAIDGMEFSILPEILSQFKKSSKKSST